MASPNVMRILSALAEDDNKAFALDEPHKKRPAVWRSHHKVTYTISCFALRFQTHCGQVPLGYKEGHA